MSLVRRHLPTAWALLLPLVILGPALAPGYVLSYDMVWVPDLALRSDFLGLGSALPRGVPSDAVVAVLDNLVPGMVLQKILLLGALVLAGLGARGLAPEGSVVGRLVAVTFYVWNPFVAERLVLGHWTVLLAYAALPWLFLAGGRWREQGRVPLVVLVLLPLASLSASAGVIAGVAVLACTWRRGWLRSNLVAVSLVLAANLPWLVAGLLHAGSATSSSGGSVFALNAEGHLPGPVAALSLGGVWNTEVVPASRLQLFFPLVATAVLVVVAVVGGRALLARAGGRATLGLVVMWAVGFGVALVSWAVPGAVGWTADHVPGGGLLRDGSRLLALCAPLLAALAGAAFARVAALAREAEAEVLVAIAGCLVPLVALPDAAWGVGGALSATAYPSDFEGARRALEREAPDSGDLVVLPFTSYRAPAWNDGHKVLDPLGRYLPPNYVASDELSVSGQVLSGEDPRGPEVLAALAEPDPESRAVALGRLGIGLVARELDVATTSAYDADVAGAEVFTREHLGVVRIEAPVATRSYSAARVVALTGAWSAFLLVSLSALVKIFLLMGKAMWGCSRRSG